MDYLRTGWRLRTQWHDYFGAKGWSGHTYVSLVLVVLLTDIRLRQRRQRARAWVNESFQRRCDELCTGALESSGVFGCVSGRTR
jgi:hypothetical protein